METSFQNFKTARSEEILSFLWRQWSPLGVAGHAQSGDPWLIDPEALLLFSTSFARQDARLFDEILDWLHVNGSWISLQRLGRIQKEESLGDATILAAIAESLAKDSAHHKWKTFLKAEPPTHSPEEFFPGVPVLGKPDPVFLKWGWLRTAPQLRAMSQTPRPDQPATFLFKLRALFGRQARVEVIAWLLAHESGHPAQIARDTSYYRRSVQIVLNELEVSGHIRSHRQGREKIFSIRRAEWRHLLTWSTTDGEDALFPQWIQWAPLFGAIQSFLRALDKPGLDEDSAPLQAIHLRKVLLEIYPALHRAGLTARLQSSPDLRGRQLTDALLKDIKTFLP